MNLDKKHLLLYAVTDRMWLKDRDLAADVELAIKGGATFIQLREKNITDAEFIAITKDVKEITDKYNIPYVINDNVDVAIAVNADGVHIGQSDEELISARKRLGADKIIGVSTQTVEQAKLAEKNGADYLGVGAAFATSTKDAEVLPLERIIEICDAVSIPVVAIGGIAADNIHQLADTHIDGIAVVSAIFAQNDIRKATKELLEQISKIV